MKRFTIRRKPRKVRTNRKQRGGYPSDPSIGSTIKQFVMEAIRDKQKRSFNLSFTIHGIPYSTVFHITPLETKVRLYNYGSCIDIYFYLGKETFVSKITSAIHADWGKKIDCFSPKLVTRTEPPRVTTTDVLQVLSTKLKLLFSDTITINDQAAIDSVILLPYRLLRGGDGLYEKYGYKNDQITEIKEALNGKDGKDGLLWGSVKYALEEDMIELVEDLQPKTDNTSFDEKRVVDLMVHVPKEMEAEHEISYELLRYCGELLEKREIQEMKTDVFFTLDRNSDEWRRWNESLVFKSISEV